MVVVADDINARGLEILARDGRFDVVDRVGDAEGLRDAIRSADGLLVRSATRVTEDLLQLGGRLRVVGRAGIGIDNIDVNAATRRGVAVINAPGANTVSAAEHTVALLLSLLRRIPEAAASMGEGKWDRKSFGGTELRGKTLGVAGVGRVGSHVSQILRAFGMSVIAYDPFLPPARARELGIQLTDLEDVIRRADVLTLHMPLNSDTQGLLNAERIGTMKPGAVLVNTARGGLVDELALADAVSSGTISGAALDVFADEPLAEDSPLRTTPGILVTPHLGASTAEAQERVATEICESMRDALLTGNVQGAVNIPGVSGRALGRLRPLLELSRRVGMLAAGVFRDRVESVLVRYGGDDDDAPKPVMLSATEGVLAAMGVSPVSIINAMALADGRGMEVERSVGHPERGFEATVRVTVTGGDRSVSVAGALFGESIGRIIEIDGFGVDFQPEGHVIVLRNKDVPGVIGRVGSVLGEAKINIAAYHQSRGPRGNCDALAAIAVDAQPDSQLIKELEGLQDVVQVRAVELR